MKSLSYLKSCIKKTDNQIPTTLTMVKILHNLKIKKTEENLSKYGIRTLRKVHFHFHKSFSKGILKSITL